MKHVVETAHERSWSTLRNRDLLRTAEADGFDVLVSMDTNLKYQQNLSQRRLAVVVLLTTNWPRARKAGEAVA